jgi:hypothetical protein
VPYAVFVYSKIKCMKPVRIPSASVLAALLLMVHSAAPSATTCVGMPPLKTLHRVRGVVFFPSGVRIPNANVSVLEGDKEIAVQKTDDHGKFSFDQLKPGNYELRIRVDGVPGIAATRVVLARPNAKAKKEIAVNFSLTAASCSSFSLVDVTQFEAGLKSEQF